MASQPSPTWPHEMGEHSAPNGYVNDRKWHVFSLNSQFLLSILLARMWPNNSSIAIRASIHGGKLPLTPFIAQPPMGDLPLRAWFLPG
jgi:hypothetical protein